MIIKFYRLILLLICSIMFLTCGGDEDSGNTPQNNDPLTNPKDCSNYNTRNVSATISYRLSTPNFVSADTIIGSIGSVPSSESEDFVFKVTPLDSNLNETSLELSSIRYSIMDTDGDSIIESDVLPPKDNGYYIVWDVTLNNEPYYGEFQYEIEFNFEGESVIVEGTAFAVSCELISKCCIDFPMGCGNFLDPDFCSWSSSLRNGRQSLFAVGCCR